MIDNSTIDRFLAESIRAAHDRSDQDQAGKVEIEWDVPSVTEKVWSRIDYHGVAAFLFYQRENYQHLPKSLWERIADEARIISLWEATHKTAVKRVIEAFVAAGIDTIVMKGTALAYDLYAVPDIRRRGDTDLLVRENRGSAASKILTDLGWSRRAGPYGLYFQESWEIETAQNFRHVVDLHLRVSDRPLIQSFLSPDKMFGSVRTLRSLSAHAKCPALPLTLLQCTLNQVWHESYEYKAEASHSPDGYRLIWLHDLDLLARAMSKEDWQELASLCETSQTGRLVARRLTHAQRVFATPLSEANLKDLKAIATNKNLEILLSGADNLDEFWLDLQTTPTVLGRAQLLAKRAFPPRWHLLEKYPGARRWPTALLQIRSAISTACRILRKALRP